jgi:signal transduction histidine kinase
MAQAKPGERLSMRPGAPVALAMLIVVVSFAAALVYLQLHLQPVTHRALAVIDHAAPSIEHLSAAQTELTALGMYVSDYVSRVGETRAVSRGNVSETRHELAADLGAFRALSDFQAEADLLRSIDGDLRELDRLTARAMDETDAGQLAEAKQTLHGGFQPQLLQTSAHISDMKALNAQYARSAAVDILRTRREAMLVSGAFGAVGLAVAVVATLLLLRLLGIRARLIDQQTEMLAARARELEAFAGRVAHDLRNPLSAIALRVLAASRRPDIEPRVRDDLDKVAGQVGRLNDIINGLLEFARAGANPEPDACADLGETLDAVMNDLRPVAAEAGVELRAEPFARTLLACTPGALTSVLANLVGNAVKYVDDGPRTPRVLVRVRDQGERARIEVEDNGPGLPPGAEARIFEPFRRLTQSAKPGIGLGLATVKKIVEAYRGRIGVESKLGRGSTFWFEMPRAARLTQAAGRAPAARSPEVQQV